MKRLILTVFICIWASFVGSVLAAPQDWSICYEGTEASGGGQRDYQYELKNITNQAVNLNVVYVGTFDSILADYTNILMPNGWVFSIVGGGGKTTPGVSTPLGQIAPAPIQCDGMLLARWGLQNGVNVAPGATVTFGFDNPNPSQNVDWYCAVEPTPGANWNSPVAGPLGTFTDGPVHGPVPEPATLLLLGLGGLAIVRKRR
jgi:hypothetical protein